jgi:predicted dehydrogenase
MSVDFGIWGCGAIARRHAQHIKDHPEATLAAAYDIRPERAVALCGNWGGVAEMSAEEFLGRPCAVVSICTPNGLHAEHAIQALEAGHHVLVEKPMSLTRRDCERMIEASLRAGRHIFVVKQNRYNPPVRALKDVLSGHGMGRILSVQVNCFWNRRPDYYQNSDWKGKVALDGGTLFTQFSHFVDVMVYLLGDAEVLFASFSNANHAGLIEFEDTGIVTFRLLDHAATGSLHFTTCAFAKNMEGSITVFGEQGTVKIGGQYLNVVEYAQGVTLDVPDSGPVPPNEYGSYQGSMSNHDKVIQNVVDTILGRDSVMTNAMEGLRVVDLIERMYAAGR